MSTLSLRAARIQDFRVLRHLVLHLDQDETVIIGENNSGKSAVLKAFDVALNGDQTTRDDLHVDGARQRADGAEVDLLIVPRDGSDFGQEVDELFGPAVLPPTAGLPMPHIVLRTRLRETGTGGALQLRRQFMSGWHESRDEAAAATVLAGSSGRVGPPQLRMLSYSLLDASRDLVAELRTRTSNWGRILSDLGMNDADREELGEQLQALGDDITAKSPTLDSVKGALSRLTAVMASGAAAIDLAALPPTIDDLARGVDVLVTAPGSARMPMRVQGSGSRSMVSLLVFRSLVDLRLTQGAAVNPLPLVGIEEPEAHLHPQSQRAAYRQVADLPGQRIIATHSPVVAGAAQPTSLRRLARVGDTVDVHSLEDAVPDAVTVFQRFVLRHRAEVLFARLVIIVEGETEEPALQEYVRQRWALVDPDGAGLVVVSADGVGNVHHVAASLSALGIDWLALVDNDEAGTDAVSALDQLVGRDTTAAPQVTFTTESVNFEHLAVGTDPHVVIDLLVADRATNAHHAAALQQTLGAYDDSTLVEHLERLKPRWGWMYVQRVLGAGGQVPVFEDLLARAAAQLGVAA